MLTHLSIQNFTLVDLLELELHQGMTAITGETGAGKSIMLDALGLTLGDRAESDRVRHGRERADICATFDITHIARAQRWLQQHDLNILDSESECLLRRVVTREGRSRGYINGQPVPLAQLKELGEMLIDIHSQHAHQSLLKKDTHRRLLDDFAHHPQTLKQTQQSFKQWQVQQQRFEEWRDNAEELTARTQLLRYQLDELEALALEEGELQQLEQEQRELASAESILQTGQALSQMCDDDGAGIHQALTQALQLLRKLGNKPDAFTTTEELLQSAQIQVQEAQHELSGYLDSFEMNPERLTQVEERLSCCFDIARKHRVAPEELLQLQANLQQELEQLGSDEQQLDTLEQAAREAYDHYLASAKQLSQQRHHAAQTLQQQINQQLHTLAMKHAQVSIVINSNTLQASAHGIDDIEFLIATNPGQKPKPLAKVASGGELSRVSLAIQVVTAQSSTTPTLVFDEVDVGIGGATADVVGELLRQLGKQGQVLCVTHLPQVACKAHHHLLVHKEADEHSAQSTLTRLDGDAKILEVARMMGGTQMTKQTIAHAREMLELAS